MTAELGFYALCFALMIGVFAGYLQRSNRIPSRITSPWNGDDRYLYAVVLTDHCWAGVWYPIGMATDCGLGDLPAIRFAVDDGPAYAATSRA